MREDKIQGSHGYFLPSEKDSDRLICHTLWSRPHRDGRGFYGGYAQVEISRELLEVEGADVASKLCYEKACNSGGEQ